jgi:glycosyltransferase involved in cell wall biosynthesis
MKDLSILIPTYNDVCYSLVSQLQQQAFALGIEYEIIVADDGSTNAASIAANRAINQFPHCKMIECGTNSGRAAIRNFLAVQAHYEWLLFIDSDMVVCRTDYLQQYAANEDAPVVDGGVVIGKRIAGNLRSMYEATAEQEHTAEKRNLSPYRDFHTANFMIHRDVMQAHPFDLRFRHYGYEDVLFGKRLQQDQIPICHIDNPLSFEVFETNADFVSKTEEGLNTLWQFRNELKGYSRLLEKADKLPSYPIRFWHRIFGRWERRNLTGSHPSLLVFNLYRMGYFMSLSATATVQSRK